MRTIRVNEEITVTFTTEKGYRLYTEIQSLYQAIENHGKAHDWAEQELAEIELFNLLNKERFGRR